MLKAVRTLMSAIWVAAIATVSAASALADEWAPLAEVGPWPAATGLIGYNGRLWFANAVRYPDHNSADVYSLDPATGAVRYERHLFSQDVGHPVVAGGLLYWPFEDARVSLGWGHFALTNGAEWRMGVVPTAQIFHVFALAEREDELIAATSAWRAGLHVSTDLGRSWRQIYDRPTPERRVSRIIELMPLNGALYGASVDRLADGAHHALVRFDGAEPVVQDGWPRDARVSGLAAHGDWLYGIVAQPGGGAIWRTDGRRSEKVAVPLGGLDLRDIASAPDGLWATGIHGRNGALFFSADGMTWTLSHELIGGHPIDVAVLDDRVFVGGRGNNGRGIVWGSPPSTAVSEPHDFTPMPPPTPTDVDWHALGARLDALLVDSASYERRDTELRDVLFQVAREKPPPGFFEARLATPIPDLAVSRFGGARNVSTAKLGRFMLMWAMTQSGSSTVPADDFGADWIADDRRSQKFTEPAIAAMRAVSWTGQRDRATIEALLDRLQRPDDPLWLKGDAVGALSAVTGQRFGYDFAAWRRWWGAAGPTWRDGG